MRTIIFLFCFVLGILFLSSCGRTHCPGFPEYLFTYLPYKKGDTLSFVNQHNDTVSFRVNGIGWQGEHSISKCGKCECKSPEFVMNADYLYCIISPKDIVFGLHKSYLGDEVSDNEVYYSQLISYFGYIEDWQNPNNGPIFGETVTLENEFSKISKVLIVWEKGITEFYDQKYDFQWKNINN